ncbi:MAG: NAD(P)H-dependent glycerol-3-phosphate dehydrogenase [Akkermansiaceae bacterium]
MSSPTTKAVILGSGSWGTALAVVLSEHFKDVVLVGRSQEQAEEINTQHTNRKYLPKVSLPKNIRCTTELKEAKTAEIILFVIPTSATRETAHQLAKIGISPNVPLISCAKGIERGTGARMSNIIYQALPKNPIAVISGPNHAEEVAEYLATCTVVGSIDKKLTASLQEMFSTANFRTYTSHDVAGMELGGALKNVFAIAAGIASGIGLGDNAIAALVTRGLAEMTRLGIALGGQPDTFMGLSGMGDLMTTCYSPHSRNNRVGKALGQGLSIKQATDQLGMVAEGVPNTLSIYEAARETDIDTPILDAVYQVLYQNKPATQALQELLTRDPKAE